MSEQKAKILAVDDEQEFTDMLRQYFEPRGFDVDIADNGITGVEMFKKGSYAVVLLDLKMSGMNGDAAMKMMRDIDPNMRAIIISAFSDSGKTQSRVIEEGAFAYVEKPIASLKELEILVKRAIDKAY
ncbi:MAG TPA: response regulator [Candidatus Omnitrophota bacterium]|nr:response regulator [Candidatus Omnitrophota bacterium]HPS20291.1 response regulator [Candidatus Omnitrophota bacterium]